MKNPLKAQTCVQKVKLKANLLTKIIILEFFAAVGIPLQIFMVGPCAITKLLISGHYHSNII